MEFCFTFYIRYLVVYIDLNGSIEITFNRHTVACWQSNCRRSGTSLVFLKD